MKKQANFRLVVFPKKWWSHDFANVDDVMNLKKEILRHCDNVEEIEEHFDFACSFCGSIWETEASGEPVCCQKARAEWAAAIASASAAAHVDRP